MPSAERTGLQPFERRVANEVPIPSWWASRAEQIEALVDALARARRGLLGRSAGGRPVAVVDYGPERTPTGPANCNSALGARRPEAYCDRAARARPVLMVIAGVHGAEVEGMMGACSLLRILDAGVDLRGRPQPELHALIERLRVVVVPLANPDGRVRVPYDGFVGLPGEEMHRVNQGTRRDGSLWGWPGCKSVHPMRGDVGTLGGYFDDAGVNLMHDEWHAPNSPLTRPLLELVASEAPDVLLNLHSYEHPPALLRTAYAPRAMKEALHELAGSFRARCEAAGIAAAPVRPVEEDGAPGRPPPAFNLASMCAHVGAGLSAVFESPHGLADGPEAFGYDEILDLHHILFAVAAERCLGVHGGDRRAPAQQRR